MAVGKKEKEQRELPDWVAKEAVPWYQKEAAAALVSVEQPQAPWYMEEASQRRLQVEPEVNADPAEQQYFRRLISLLDDQGWNQSRLSDTVGKWLSNQDHYRFVSMVRPVAADWVAALTTLGVEKEHALRVRAAIENQLYR